MSFGTPPQPPNPFGSQALDLDNLDAESALEYETEIVICRRCFSTAQQYLSSFSGVVLTQSAVSLNWHDTNVDLNQGSFAVVQSDADYTALVGEVVRVSVGLNSVFAYVVAESSVIQTDMTLARRPFLELATWAQPLSGLLARVEVMQ